MKVIITESNLKDVIFRYFDNQKSKGQQPYVSSRLYKLFKSDEDTLLDYLFDYLGGRDGATEVAKKMLKELPDRIKINDAQFEGEFYYSIYDVGSEINPYDGYLPVFIDCYGDVNGAPVWNDDNGDYDYIDTTLYDWYSELDMTEGWEVKDTFVSDINGQFFDLITRYTGVPINVEGFSVIDG